MTYGVNSWAAQLGRAPAAGSSKRRSTRTGKRKKAASVRRAKKKQTRRRLPAPLAKSKKLDPRDYHALPIGKAPKDWGGSQTEWILYSQGKGEGKWL